MENPPPNVFNLNQQQAQNVVDDVFGDIPNNMLPPHIDDEDAQYNDIYVKPFPPDKLENVIGVTQLEPNVVYYKVMDNDTNFDINQLEYVGNPDLNGIIYQFKNNLGHDNIPLTNQSRFIPAYLMLDKSTPNPVDYKNKFFSIYGIDKEETSNDEDSSDSDNDSDDSEMELEG